MEQLRQKLRNLPRDGDGRKKQLRYLTFRRRCRNGRPVAVVDGLFTDRDSLEYKYRDGDNMPVDNAEYTIELRLDGTSKSADGLTTLRLKAPRTAKSRDSISTAALPAKKRSLIIR